MPRRVPELTPVRATRLCRMLRELESGPQSKADLVQTLEVEERGFFRDLKFIRQLGVEIESKQNAYTLCTSYTDALSLMPLPDLRLSLRDVLDLTEGPTPTHRSVRRKLERIVGPVRRRR